MNLFLVFAATACFVWPVVESELEAAENDKWVLSGQTMGPIQYQVVIAHPDKAVDQAALKLAVQDSLDRVNALMSTWLADSDVGRFNRSNSTDWLDVESETVTVVAKALEMTNLTDGAFNIRVAAAVDRWKFGPAKGNSDSNSFVPPSDAEIETLQQLIENGKVETRADPPAIRKTEPGIKIDLSAIAKGYAVDQVARTLAEKGCDNFMVEVGGEVVTKGQRAEGGPWRIGIENPDQPIRTIRKVVQPGDAALATSGDYRNWFEHAGQRYSHTIDPKTCRPVTHFLASACVVAEDCLTADALATAVMVLGAERGHELSQRLGCQLYTIDRDGGFDGDLVDQTTKDFPFAEAGASTPVAKTDKNKSNSDVPQAASIWPAFIASIVVISLAILGMAVGAIVANKPVRGSCGGLAAMSGADSDDASCGVCSKPVSDCVEKTNDG